MQYTAAEYIVVQLQQSACEERRRPSELVCDSPQPQRVQGEPHTGG